MKTHTMLSIALGSLLLAGPALAGSEGEHQAPRAANDGVQAPRDDPFQAPRAAGDAQGARDDSFQAPRGRAQGHGGVAVDTLGAE